MEPKMQPKNWRRKGLTRESHKSCRQRLEKKDPDKRISQKMQLKNWKRKNLTEEPHKK
jgi:hypothetical protein